MPVKKLILGVAALLSVAVLLRVGAGDDAPAKPDRATNQRPEKVSKDAPPLKNTATTPENPQRNHPDQAAATAGAAEDGLAAAADVEALLATAETFVIAYNKGDAKTIANLFSPNAEYIDEQGYRFHGRPAIERAITACLAAHKGAQIQLSIHSLRQVAPGVAIEDGTTTLTSDKLSSGPIETHYTATHVKIDGNWQTVSVRETPPNGHREHQSQLQQLSWLLGDWVDEGEDTLVFSSCKPIQGGNFLLREFKMHDGGKHIISGDQRIGWDASTGEFKSWVFDSDGGYSEGVLEQDDNRWILKSVGVSTHGQPVSCTTIFTVIDQNTMTWETVDHEVAGMQIPDSDVMTVVRRAPGPNADRETASPQER